MKVKKIIIPAAGFGTRMLPQTKAMPKEMMPVVNKPVIQYIVEEAVEAGIEEVIVVTGYHKRAIEDHFDNTYELEEKLKEKGKIDELEEIRRIADMAKFVYIRQKGDGYGNAIPVKCARHLIGDEPFALLWGDIIADKGRLKQAVEAFEEHEAPILCGQRTTDPSDAEKYGYIKGDQVREGLWKVSDYIEKPGAENKPSDIAILNGYVLTPDIFPLIDSLSLDKSGEYCLIDAIKELAKKRDVFAIELDEVAQYDTGNKLAYAKTFIDFAMKDKTIGDEVKSYIKKKLK